MALTLSPSSLHTLKAAYRAAEEVCHIDPFEDTVGDAARLGSLLLLGPLHRPDLLDRLTVEASSDDWRRLKTALLEVWPADPADLEALAYQLDFAARAASYEEVPGSDLTAEEWQEVAKDLLCTRPSQREKSLAEDLRNDCFILLKAVGRPAGLAARARLWLALERIVSADLEARAQTAAPVLATANWEFVFELQALLLEAHESLKEAAQDLFRGKSLRALFPDQFGIEPLSIEAAALVDSRLPEGLNEVGRILRGQHAKPHALEAGKRIQDQLGPLVRALRDGAYQEASNIIRDFNVTDVPKDLSQALRLAETVLSAAAGQLYVLPEHMREQLARDDARREQLGLARKPLPF